ncbi:MAG: hypothetical protein ABEI75_00910, partial [Halobaculum sp.]
MYLTGLGTYLPDETVTGAEIAAASGIPESVVTEKMGIREKRVCPPDADHATAMSCAAGRRALADAGIPADALDLVVYHGSEYKDHVVWSAAAAVCERLGASEAYAHESYSLCAGAPVAVRHTAAQLRTGDVDRALLVAASREEDLVDYENEDASFMFNFGSGGSAFVLEAAGSAPESPGAGEDAPETTGTSTDAAEADGTTEASGGTDETSTTDDGAEAATESSATGGRRPSERARARVRASAALTDGSFADDVVMPAGGSVHPPSVETVRAGMHTLD